MGLATWPKRGVGLYWEPYEKPAVNPVSGKPTVAHRRRLRVDLDLPMGEEYSRLMNDLLQAALDET